MNAIFMIFLLIAIIGALTYSVRQYALRQARLQEHEANGDIEPAKVVSLVPSPDANYPSARIYTATFVDEQGILRREAVEATSLWEAKWLAMRNFHWPQGMQVL